MYKLNKYNNKNIRNIIFHVTSFSPFTSKYYTLRKYVVFACERVTHLSVYIRKQQFLSDKIGDINLFLKSERYFFPADVLMRQNLIRRQTMQHKIFVVSLRQRVLSPILSHSFSPQIFNLSPNG